MRQRKNKKRIDPRYFLDETTNRDQGNPDLEEYESIDPHTMYTGDISNTQLDTSDLPEDPPQPPPDVEDIPPPPEEDVMPPDFVKGWKQWKNEPETPPPTAPEVPKKPMGEPRVAYLGDGNGVGWVDDSYDGGGRGSPGVLDRPVLPGEGNMAWSPDGRSEFGHGDQFDWAWDEEGDVDHLFTGGPAREGALHPVSDGVVPYDLVRQHARDKGLRIATEDDAHNYWAKNWRVIAPMISTTGGEKEMLSSKLNPDSHWYNPTDVLRKLYNRAGKGSDGGIPRDPPGRLEWKPYERGQLTRAAVRESKQHLKALVLQELAQMRLNEEDPLRDLGLSKKKEYPAGHVFKGDIEEMEYLKQKEKPWSPSQSTPSTAVSGSGDGGTSESKQHLKSLVLQELAQMREGESELGGG